MRTRKLRILLPVMIFTLMLGTSVSLVHADILIMNLYITPTSNTLLASYPGGSVSYAISARWYVYQVDPLDYLYADLSITNWSPSVPAGITASFNTTTLHPLYSSGQFNEYIGSTNATLTMTTSGSATPGTYTFTVELHQPLTRTLTVTGTLTVFRPIKTGLWEAEEDLMAGQHTNVGQLLMYDTAQSLVVRFDAKPDWRITETHLAIATSPDGIPQTKKGNPIPGQFQYKNDTLNSVESCQFNVPMTWASGTTLYIAAHCVVKGVGEFCGQTESAWAGNLMFPGRNWANYTTYFTEYSPPMGYS